MVFTNGDSYDGEWSGGNKNGRGIYNFANGDSYEGYIENEKRSGRGIYRWQNNTKVM